MHCTPVGAVETARARGEDRNMTRQVGEGRRGVPQWGRGVPEIQRIGGQAPAGVPVSAVDHELGVRPWDEEEGQM